MIRFAIMKTGLISIFFLFLTSCCFGQNDELFLQGNAAYAKESYAEAITSYSTLISEGFQSAQLYHNLGNAYFKEGRLGKAILYFEKAHKMKPSDNNIEKNLMIARDEVDTPFVEIPEFFLSRFWKSFSGLLSPSMWMMVLFILGLIMVYGIYKWRLGEGETSKTKGFAIMAVGSSLLIISYFAGLSAQGQVEKVSDGIIMMPTGLYAAADDRSEQKEPLSEGVKVKVIDKVDNWYQVSLVNKEIGWVDSQLVEMI